MIYRISVYILNGFGEKKDTTDEVIEERHNKNCYSPRADPMPGVGI